MLIDCGDLVRAWKIIAAYRQLRPEYTSKIQARAKRIARHGVKAKSTPPPEKPPPRTPSPKKALRLAVELALFDPADQAPENSAKAV